MMHDSRFWGLALRLLLALALLSGCASSSPPAALYLLPSERAAVGNAPEQQPSATLLIPPPRLAGYLDVPGIVLQLDDVTVNQAGSHRWAEDLSLLLQRGLRERLADRLGELRVLTEGSREALELWLDFEGFHGQEGTALASGQWQLRDAEGVLLAEQRFRVESELEADGYPALVRALGRSLTELADGIAREVSAVVAPSQARATSPAS